MVGRMKEAASEVTAKGGWEEEIVYEVGMKGGKEGENDEKGSGGRARKKEKTLTEHEQPRDKASFAVPGQLEGTKPEP